jgi:hypothetical protein
MFKLFKHIGLFLLVAFMFIGCEKESIKPDSEFRLALNDTKTVKSGLNSVDVTYSKLIEDSRCPDSSTCVWAGRAIVLLTDDKNKEYKIGIGDLESVKDEIQNEVEIDGFVFKLIDVKDRSITLKVTK